MNVILDLGTCVIAFLCIFFAYRKGLLKSVLGLLSTVIAMTAAYFLSTPVGDFINNKIMTPVFEKIFIKSVDISAVSGTAGNSFADIAKNAPEYLDKTLKLFNTNIGEVTGVISKNAALGAEALEKKIIDFVISPAANAVSHALALILVFVISLVALKILDKVLSGVVKLPLIKNMDKLGGIIFGIVNAAVILFIASAVISLVIPFASGNSAAALNQSAVDNTFVFKYIYNFNPIINLFR